MSLCDIVLWFYLTKATEENMLLSDRREKNNILLRKFWHFSCNSIIKMI